MHIYIIILIILRYLVKGHTQTSGDSMHSAIENAARNRSIFDQEEWCEIMRKAKVESPHYIVNEILQMTSLISRTIRIKNFGKTRKYPMLLRSSFFQIKH